MKTILPAVRRPILNAALFATCALSHPLTAADFNSSYIGLTNNPWGTPTNWSPNVVPNNGGGDVFNVTISNRTVLLDLDSTISNLTMTGNNGRITSTDHNLSVLGATSMAAAGRLTVIAQTSPSVEFNVGNLANFSGTSLNSGSYFVAAAPNQTSRLRFNGANIMTNLATIVLSGPGASIVDENGANALTNFNHHLNFIRFTDGASFTAANAFTNEGFFVVRPGCTATFSAGYTAVAGPNLFDFPGNVEVFGTEFGPSTGDGLFDVTGGSLGNFDVATRTLSDARFRLASTGAATSTLRFPGADIVDNAAQLEVVGPNTNILDEKGNNGLRNFASNSFYFALARRALSVPGDFANSAPMEMFGGGEFTVGGSMSNNEYLAMYLYDIHLNFIAPGFDPAPDFALSSKIATNSNFSLGANSYLLFEIVDTAITSSIEVGGLAVLGGLLDLYFTFDDSLITSADTLTLMTASGGFTGAFDNVATGDRLDAFFYGVNEPVGSFLVNYGGTALTISDYQVVPKLTGAVSRKVHGSAGTFDVDLPLSGTAGVECRNTGGNHTLVFTFNKEIVKGSVTVATGAGTAGAPTFSGSSMAVGLTGVTDVQTLTVSLTEVADAVGQVLPDTSVSVGILIGDTTGEGMVSASDIGEVKSQAGAALSAANFRNDLNANGVINSSDIGQAKAMSGHGL